MSKYWSSFDDWDDWDRVSDYYGRRAYESIEDKRNKEFIKKEYTENFYNYLSGFIDLSIKEIKSKWNFSDKITEELSVMCIRNLKFDIKNGITKAKKDEDITNHLKLLISVACKSKDNYIKSLL